MQVAFGRERTVFASAYTGEVLGEGGVGVRAFFRKVTDIHRWLGAGEENRALGKMVMGACNLAFLFLVVSGFYLWWPSEWSRRVLRGITWFRRGLRPRTRDFNWHNFSLGAAFLVWTGLSLSLRRFSAWRGRRRTRPVVARERVNAKAA